MHDDHDHDGHEHGKGSYIDSGKAEEEAKEVLREQIERMKKFSYAGLAALMGALNAETYDYTSKSGAQYEITVESAWQDAPQGNLVVNVAVFEKDWLSLLPVAGGFVMTPEGSIKDELVEE
ncbi:MAG: hypothetical protein HY883_03720 [Deltaproteobacteria bacterium]|nr:hypothetical protein [Deltaproteobacteria bacterium]